MEALISHFAITQLSAKFTHHRQQRMNLLNLSSSFSSWSIFLHFILLCSILLLQPSITLVSALSNETDKFALLKFKESSADPDGVLNSWNNSIHFCNWRGISCGRRHQRVRGLNLEGYNLRGIISPYIGNLSFLRFFNLGSNFFSGEIPSEVDRLFRLQRLNLSHNMLEGNIPLNLSSCSDLRILILGNNKLTGMIPMELGSLGKLVVLVLDSNNITGGIPASLGNMSSLNEISVGFNNLVGIVPEDLGRLKSLTIIQFSENNLSGKIPVSLYNISSIEMFLIGLNKFTGTLPSDIGHKLHNLRRFGVGSNEFSGIIQESFSNASRLQRLDLCNNQFVGQIPSSFGKLPDLEWLNLGNNSLGSNSANDLDFVASLTNCSKMAMLDFTYNNLGGVLPKSMANLSTQLSQLFLCCNQISGNIPTTLENLVNLIFLSMVENLFTGVIPSSVGKLTKLQVLDLGTNTLSGNIPLSIGNLTQIYDLSLEHNMLEGSIPPDIASCRSLRFLSISHNGLSAIPKEIFSLSSLVLLDHSSNSLTGGLPVEVGNLKSLSWLNLSENNLTGEIPETIQDCESLEFLYLEGNFLEGTLPSTLASLRGLQDLDISRNKFTGPIPNDLEKLISLLNLNLSSNELEGEVPKKGVFQNISAISVAGNTKLCGGVPELQLPACPIKESKHRKIIGHKLTTIMLCMAAVLLLLSGLAIFYWRRKLIRKLSPTLSTINFLSTVSYRSLYQATNGFSPSMLIGTGSFGSVFKGILDEEENVVAIKVLNLQQKGAPKSFLAECNALRNIRHRNLVKILTCCSSIDYNGNEFKALIFQYMSNGSLEKWINLETKDEKTSTSLSLIQRVNIAADVASAVYYLHHDCDQPIIHCDLKPSNVLLDDEMIAHVSDFGLAKLISDDSGSSGTQTSTIGIKGTIGYAPPEYAMGGEPSRQGDAYSYGILILEMFTGRRPTDDMFKDSFNLHNFVKTALPENVVQVVDSTLLPTEVEGTTRRREDRERNYNNFQGIEIVADEGNINSGNRNRIQISTKLQNCLISVFEIGLACSEDSPNNRMNMADVIMKIQHIKNAYMGERTSRERPSNF